MAIRMSEKQDMLYLNFVGNAGRHQLTLVDANDILGGDYTEDEVLEAKKVAKEKQTGGEKSDPVRALREARERLRRAVSVAPARVTATVSAYNPFELLGVDLGENSTSTRFGTKRPTPPQLEALLKMGVAKDELEALTRREASALLTERDRRRSAGLATFGQLKMLKRFGVFDRDIGFPEANKAMTYLKAKGWGKKEIDQKMLNTLLGRDTDV
jgi:hypothetical protein